MAKTLTLKWLSHAPAFLVPLSCLPLCLSPGESGRTSSCELGKLGRVDEERFCSSLAILEVLTSGPNSSTPGRACGRNTQSLFCRHVSS